MSEYITASLVIFSAGFIQGLTGFGFGMIAVPLLAILLGVKKAIPLAALISLTLLVIMTAKTWRQMDGGKITTLAAGSIPGIPFGIYILTAYDEAVIKTMLALLLIVYSLYTLFASAAPPRMNERMGYVFGFVSGIFSGAINTGGPPVVIYGSMQGWESGGFRATLTGFFIINQAIVVAAHAASGVSSTETLFRFSILVPFVAAGALAGAAFYEKISQEAFKAAVTSLLLIVGVIMLFS